MKRVSGELKPKWLPSAKDKSDVFNVDILTMEVIVVSSAERVPHSPQPVTVLPSPGGAFTPSADEVSPGTTVLSSSDQDTLLSPAVSEPSDNVTTTPDHVLRTPGRDDVTIASDDVTRSPDEGVFMSERSTDTVMMITHDGAQVNGNVFATTEVTSAQEPNTTTPSEENVNYCLVCGDRGSGFHYSVYSCEGCKGFFKRTVQKNLSYNCKEDKNCTINRMTRNNCQFCRYVKCIEVGMKREAVREDRTPGGKQRGKRLSSDVRDGTYYIRDDIVMEAPDEELMTALVVAKPDTLPEIDDGDASPSRTESVASINELMQYGYEELRLIILWAKKVPGFRDLCLSDQMSLLKSSFMELNVLRLSWRSLDCPGRVRFAKTVTMTADESVDIGWGSDLILATLDFIHRLQDISLDHTEYCLINALVLTYPDAPGLRNRSDVIGLQTKILNCLRKYIGTTYIAEPRRFGKLLLRLPALRSVSAKAAEKFLTLTISGAIEMNDLVREMMR